MANDNSQTYIVSGSQERVEEVAQELQTENPTADVQITDTEECGGGVILADVTVTKS